jgi:homoserine O-acetyltransferase/O-succinyltransferase
VGRGRQSVEHALQLIRAKTLVIGITSDVLFPLSEQQFLAEQIPGARLATIESHFGHDGFLLEYEALSQHLKSFLQGVASYTHASGINV